MHDDTLKTIKPVRENAAGRVVNDGRGRNVWQWKDAEIDSTSLVLKRLENDALELEPTRKVPVQKPGAQDVRRAAGRARSGAPDRGSAEQAAPPRDASRYPERPARVRLSIDEPDSRGPGGGFDPYNRS